MLPVPDLLPPVPLVPLLPLVPVPVPVPVPPPPVPPLGGGAGGAFTVTVTELAVLPWLAFEQARVYVCAPVAVPTFTAVPLLLVPLLPLQDPDAVQVVALVEDHENVTVELVVTVAEVVPFTFREAVGLGQLGRFAVATWCHVTVPPMSCTQRRTGHLLSVSVAR